MVCFIYFLLSLYILYHYGQLVFLLFITQAVINISQVLYSQLVLQQSHCFGISFNFGEESVQFSLKACIIFFFSIFPFLFPYCRCFIYLCCSLRTEIKNKSYFRHVCFHDTYFSNGKPAFPFIYIFFILFYWSILDIPHSSIRCFCSQKRNDCVFHNKVFSRNPHEQYKLVSNMHIYGQKNCIDRFVYFAQLSQ